MDLNAFKANYSHFADNPYREYQEDAIGHILNSPRRIDVLRSPTGSGKSLIGTCCGAAYPNYIYLVSSIHLQEQIERDFPEVIVMKGRSNFPCRLIEGFDCSECIHTKATPCPERGNCEYEINKKKALSAKFKVLNYHYFLYEANFVGRFSNPSVIICDEADALENILSGFISLHISIKHINRYGIHRPDVITGTAKNATLIWKYWADTIREKISADYLQVLQYLDEYRENTDDLAHMLKKEYELNSLLNRLDIFIQHADKSWIFEQDQRGITFKPTWLMSQLTHKYFFSHAPKFIMMSATFPIVSVYGKLLGLNLSDISYLDLPSTFPKENRTIYLKRVADLKYDNRHNGPHPDQLKNIYKEIKNLLDRHSGQRGIIHSVSYKLTGQIMGAVRNKRLITHDSVSKNEVIDKFKAGKYGLDAVLVSPVITRGVDFPYKECEFIIIPKAPFPNLADKLVSNRLYSGKLGQYWYQNICAQEIVQATGRGMRNIDDHCVIYIIEIQAINLIMRNQNMFPQWWRDALDVEV